MANTPVALPNLPQPYPTIILIGLRGSGKTSVARVLAAITTPPSTTADLDERVAQAHGVAEVAAFIRAQGLDAFRAAELSTLRTLLQRMPRLGVIALGGGTPTAPGAAEFLAGAARAGIIRIVYLRAQPGVLIEHLRTTNLADRPSLTGAGTLEEVATVFEQRDQVYCDLAQIIIEVAGLTLEAIASRIIHELPHVGSPPAPGAG